MADEVSCPFCIDFKGSSDIVMAHIVELHPDSPDKADDQGGFSTASSSVDPCESELTTIASQSDKQDKVKPFCCPICEIQTKSANEIELHINQVHFRSSTHPSSDIPASDTATLPKHFCPICNESLESSTAVTVHIEHSHPDQSCISSITDSSVEGAVGYNYSDDATLKSCPVCGSSNFSHHLMLVQHIDDHYNKKRRYESNAHNTSDEQPSVKVDSRELQKIVERDEFAKLQAKYGMDGKDSYRKQYQRNIEKAAYRGNISFIDYYEKKQSFAQSQQSGVDDGSTCTTGVMKAIKTQRCWGVKRMYVCSDVDHHGGSYGDKGWGCGYRNIQMLLSYLQHQPRYAERLFTGESAMPSLFTIQKWIEQAWNDGFDLQGCEQLGGQLFDSRKWIGASEAAALLASRKVRCELIDFHKPTGENGTHLKLFQWCKEYFSSGNEFLPPLYLQHQGHSRTIVGCEVFSGKQEKIFLLILDPSHSKTQMKRLIDSSKKDFVLTENNQRFSRDINDNCNAGSSNTMIGYTLSGNTIVENRGPGFKSYNATTPCDGRRKGVNLSLVRRPLNSMKAKQYQLVVVTGLIDNDELYQASKVLRSTRIP